MLRRGATGLEVAALREKLHALGLLPMPDDSGARPADVFDLDTDAAVRAFQQRRGLVADGIVGPATQRELAAAGWRLGDRALAQTIAVPLAGDDVAELQRRLADLGYDAGRADGMFSAQLDRAVRQFQHHRGLIADGVFGPTTLHELQRISPMATGGRPQYLREVGQMRQAGPRLHGKRIVIDPVGGPDEPGWVIDDIRAADLTFDMAQRLCTRMTAAGIHAFLTREAGHNPDATQRAKIANDLSADLVIGLDIDGCTSARARGIATFCFGTDTGAVSPVGESLAALVQRELVARTGMLDCRTHHRTWEILRRTKAPAIQVEIGYMTNPIDRARLLDPDFRDRVVDGVLVATKRLYLDKKDDRPTGTFSFEELLEYEQAMSRS